MYNNAAALIERYAAKLSLAKKSHSKIKAVYKSYNTAIDSKLDKESLRLASTAANNLDSNIRV